MADGPFRRALPSSELPQPHPASWVEASTRKVALQETVSVPRFREVDVAGRPVLVTRLPSGEAVAFSAECPHQGTSLRDASLYEGHLRCPKHNYVYDLHTGRNILPTRDARPQALERLKPGYLVTYPVRERDGWILISDEPHPPPSPHDVADADQPELPGVPEAPAGPVEHPEEALTAVVGQPFEVVLDTPPRPSHLWKMETDHAAVEILSQRYHQDAQGLSYRILLRPHRDGVVRLRFVYGLPWACEPSVVRPFVIDVQRPT